MKEKSKKFFDLYFFNSIGLLCIVSIDGRFIMVNPECENIIGYSSSVIKGKSFIEFVHPDDAESSSKSINQLIKNSEPQRFINRFRYKDGKYRKIEWKWFPLEDSFCASAREIPGQEIVDDVVANERNILRALVDNIPDLVYIKDTESRFVITNSTLAGILNTTVENLIGKSDMELFPYEKATDFLNDEKILIETGKPVINKEETIFDSNGNPIIFQTTKLPLRDKTGKITGFVGTGHIITEQKQYEEALKKRVLALTKPLDDPEGVKFTDLFDVEELQVLQDTFAEATGVASLITYPDGTPITQPGRFCSLCKLIRSTEKGAANCFKSDAYIGKQNHDGPTVLPCLSGGIWDAGASITLGGKHLANWLIGQIRNEAQDDNSIIKYADEIGVDPEQFRQALSEVPSMSREQFEKVSRSLFILANQLSVKAYQNVQQARFIAEQIQSKEALVKSEEQLKGITQNIPGVVFQITMLLNGEVVVNYASDNSLRYIGLENENLSGLFNRFINGIIEEDRKTLIASIKTAAQTLSRMEWEGKYIKPDGDIAIIRAISQARKLKNEIVFDGIILDITAQKSAEEQVEKLAALHQTVLNTVSVGLIFVKERRMEWANNTFLEMFGYEMSEVYNLDTSVLYAHEDDFNMVGDVAYSRFYSNQPFIAEVLAKRKDGSEFWISLIGNAIDHKKPNLGSIWMLRDISESKKSEKELFEKNAKLNSIFKAAPVAIGVTIDNILQEANDVFYEMTGYEHENINDKNLRMIYQSQDAFSHALEKNHVLKQGEQTNNIETKWIRKDGSKIDILLRLVPLDASDFLKGVIFSALDITERKKAEDEIIKLNLELEERVLERTDKLQIANRDLETFAYSISHDLRAPIRHIDGFVKLMFSKIPEPSGTIIDYFNKIKASSERMSSMIESLLSFSRLGRKELILSEVDLNIVVNEVIDEMMPDVGNRHMKWIIFPLPVIKCDKLLIKMVFENLISNAIKYTSRTKNPTIKIGFSLLDGNRVEIYIKDNGAGFDMAYANKLFGVFQRLHTSEEFEGIGIGLANVRQIVEKHKGKVRAEGELNKGAVFYVTLPK
jgi:PAS domain S-box-containing protein